MCIKLVTAIMLLPTLDLSLVNVFSKDIVGEKSKTQNFIDVSVNIKILWTVCEIVCCNLLSLVLEVRLHPGYTLIFNLRVE